MRTIIISLCLTFISLISNAQKQDATAISQDTLYARMYRNGVKYGDYRLAISSMQALFAMHPDSIKYLDSACIMYSGVQDYAQCILTGNQVLRSRPDDVPIIEAVALSNQHVGRYDEALGLFQSEYDKNTSIYACYQIAVLQYSLQQPGKAQATLDRLLTDKRALTDKIGFATTNNSTQQVLYKAAAENLMGVIYQDLKDMPKAKKCFQEALAIQPDFVLAKNNLDALEKKGEGK